MTGADTAVEAPTATPRWVDPLLWFGVWLPFVVVAGRWIGTEWFPVQDQAVLDLRVRDLTSSEAPLVGAFSRFGWSHPGPVWFVVLAPFRWLAGPTGMLVGSILWYGAGFATLAVVVRRRYGTGALALTSLALVPVLAGAGSFALLIPWNPHLAFAWYPLFLVLCVSSTSRRPGDVGPAILLGVLLVQLHVGYLPIVVAPLLTSIALVGVHEGRHALVARARLARRWLVATAAVSLPLAVEQLVHGREGNLGRVAWFFLHPPEGIGEPTGIDFGLGGIGGVLRLPLTGLGGRGEATEPFTGYVVAEAPWTVLPLVAALVGVGVAARRRGDREVLDAVVVAGVAVGAGVVALSRLVGERYAYLFTWRFALVWFALAVAVLGGAALAVRGRPPRPETKADGTGRPITALAVGSVLAVGAVVLATSLTVPTDRVLPLEPAARRLAALVAEGEPPAGPVQLVRFDGVLEGVADGVLNDLDQRGWPVGVVPDQGFKYGDHRVVGDDEASETWFVTETSLGTTLAAAVPGSSVRASLSPLDDDDERELVALQLALVERLRSQGRLDLLPAVDFDLVGFALDGQVDTSGIDLDRLGELNARVAASGSCRCAVVVVPAGTPVDPAALVGGLPVEAVRPPAPPLLSRPIETVVDADAPDPTVVVDDDGVVLLATGPHVGDQRLQARRGPDLATLGPPTEVLARTPAWSLDDRRRFWAPAVTALDDGWLLLFSAPDARSGLQCVGAARADDAAGPYEPFDEPLICPRAAGGAIDPELVAGDDGLHVLWKVDGNCCGLPTELWSQPLDRRTLALTGTAVRLLTAADAAGPGAGAPPLIEGPTMTEVDGRLVLLWSTGAWESAGYAMGAATCASPAGPCEVVDAEVPPPSPSRRGAGGGAGIVDASGRAWLVYHAWDACCVGYEAQGARRVHVARLHADAAGVRAQPPTEADAP